VTVLVFDIDDFKRFNDAYGHGAGDEILTECVRLLSAAVRPTDKVCRIGGDEFAVIFYEPEGPREPDSRHPTSVFDVAERFQAQLRSAQFRKLRDELPGCLTISGGLATYPWDGRTAEELVERADQLALEGKKQGKNVIAIGPGCRRLANG
jgi:diguanylate cyclase (GGDEF)-like protein